MLIIITSRSYYRLAITGVGVWGTGQWSSGGGLYVVAWSGQPGTGDQDLQGGESSRSRTLLDFITLSSLKVSQNLDICIKLSDCREG